MRSELIDTFIVMPLALKVFEMDKKHFDDFTMRAIYLSRIDQAISDIQKDFLELKKDMFQEHHIDVRKISATTYSVRSSQGVETIEYKPEELQKLTEELMGRYFHGDLARPHKLEPEKYILKDKKPPQ